MSTPAVPQPSVPVVSIQTLVPAPTNVVSSFLKHHETFLIVVLGFILLWSLSGKIENVIAAHDNANLHTVQATLTAQVDADKKTAAIVAQQKADFDALNARLTAQDNALRQTNATLISALAKKQVANNTLTVPELVNRWSQLVPAVNFDGAPVTADGGVSVSPANAHATVNELERVPVLEEQLANETTIASNTSDLLISSTARVATLNTLVLGKDAELKKADDVCKADIKVVKDAATKSKRRWFIGGFIAGFASRQAIKTYFGL
jgi:hypothetical protein